MKDSTWNLEGNGIDNEEALLEENLRETIDKLTAKLDEKTFVLPNPEIAMMAMHEEDLKVKRAGYLLTFIAFCIFLAWCSYSLFPWLIQLAKA